METMMKKLLLGVTAVAALALTPAVAHAEPVATETVTECVPHDAWTETIEHEAVGEPTIMVDNPDYEPTWTEEVEVSAAYWQRYSYKGAWPSNTEPPPFPGNWQANTKSDPHGIGVEGAYYRSNGNSGHGDWFYLERVPAVTETVTHPAVGDPEIEVPNPDYVEAWTETIEHDAVVCDELNDESDQDSDTESDPDVKPETEPEPEPDTKTEATPEATPETSAPVKATALKTDAPQPPQMVETGITARD